MSYGRVAAALELDSVRGMQKLALVALAHFENDKTGVCTPSYETIGKMIGTTSREVGTLVRYLISDGIISAKRTKTSSCYTFCLDKAIKERQEVAALQDRKFSSTLENQDRKVSSCQDRKDSSTLDRKFSYYEQRSRTKNIEQRNNKESITTTTPTPPTKSPAYSQASICGGGGPSRLDTSTFVCTNQSPYAYPENFKQVSDYLDANWTGAVDSDALFSTFMRLKTNHWCDGNGKPIRDWREYFAALNRIHIAKTIP